MAVTPEVQGVLDLVAAAGEVPTDELTPEMMRESYAAMNAITVREGVASVVDRSIPGRAGDIPVRIYTPTTEPGPHPCLVFYHGGGWVIGDLDTHDASVRMLANASGVTVVSVDYRLAPEHPFPAAVDDSLAAVRWVAEHGAEIDVDPARLAVGGDSAGGNLSAVVAQQARASGPDLRFQLLVYPATDGTLSSPSIDENGDGYFLTKEAMEWFWGHYMGGVRSKDPLVSPLHAPDEALAGLAPALVITAEYDPLRDEGEAYAARLEAAGVEVTATRYDRMIHGFFQMQDWVPEGRVAIDEAAAALRRALA